MILCVFRFRSATGAVIASSVRLPGIACCAPAPSVRSDAVPTAPSLFAPFTSASVITPAAICGLAAVPARSPASCTIPFDEVVASAGPEPAPAAIQLLPFQ
jgi:hypothetical protein